MCVKGGGALIQEGFEYVDLRVLILLKGGDSRAGCSTHALIDVKIRL